MTALVDVLRRLRQGRMRREIMLDPQRSLVGLEVPLDARTRDLGLLRVELEGRRLAGRSLLGIVIEIAAQHDGAAVRELHDENLMAGRVAWRAHHDHAAVAE